MSFTHQLYIGHFETDGLYARLVVGERSPVRQVAVRKPLDWAVVNELAGSGDRFPNTWAIRREADSLVGDLYALDSAAIAFIHQLVERTGCQLVERGLIVRPQDVLPRR